MREAIYGSLGADARTRVHLLLGRYLLKQLVGDNANRELFNALSHINRATALIEDELEREQVAWLNLSAGRQAQAVAAFQSAAEHYAVSRNLLPAQVWEREHGRAWLLLRSAAECEFVLARFDAASELFIELHQRAHDDLERAEIEILHTALHVHCDEPVEALSHARVAMALLGSRLPEHISVATVVKEYMRARLAIGRRTPDELLEAPGSDDRRIQLLREVIAHACTTAFAYDEKTMLVLAMRGAALSARHGITSTSAQGFLSYSLFASAFTRNSDLLEDYGQLALKIIERLPNPASESLVRFLYATLVVHWSHPIEQALAHAELGYQRGIEGGNLTYAALSKLIYVNALMHCGRPLDTVGPEVERVRVFAERVQNPEVVENVTALRQLIRALRGETVALHRLDSDDFDERAYLERVKHLRGGMLHAFVTMNRIRLAVYARLNHEAQELLNAHAAMIEQKFAFTFNLCDLLFYKSLVAAALLGRRKAARAIRAPLRQLDRYAARCPDNYLHKADLVRAELFRVAGSGEALAAYTRAINGARERGFLQDEALARELAGRFFLTASAYEAALPYLAHARQLYVRWGALAKVAMLDREFSSLNRTVSARGEQGPTSNPNSSSFVSSSESGATNLALDLDSVLRASEAFAVGNAGAERGVLVLERGGALEVELEYTARSGEVRWVRTPLAESGALSQPIALLAHRKREPVVLEDAATDPVFGDDPWVMSHGAASILCAPILHQGESLGLLYLENRLAPGVFTPHRIETLKVLAIQAAISIQHAFLYQHLEAARGAAESANQAKSRFLANMSHELRTPLNAILGYTELTIEELRDTEGDFGVLIEDLERVYRSGELLLGIISEILDLTKIEAGTIEMHPVTLDVAELLQEVAATIEIQYEGNTLCRAFGGELGEVRCDPQKLKQVLFNLLNNANKFTVDGTIVLGGQRRVDSDGCIWVDITVTDTGIGMSEKELIEIFEAFHQADTSSTREFGGVGLGLTIVQKLCNRMGARVTVSSTSGEGSTFTISLRAAAPNEAPRRPRASAE